MEIECPMGVNSFVTFVAKRTAVITITCGKRIFCLNRFFKWLYCTRFEKLKTEIKHIYIQKRKEKKWKGDGISSFLHTGVSFFVTLNEWTRCRWLRTIQANHFLFFIFYLFNFIFVCLLACFNQFIRSKSKHLQGVELK